MSAPRAGGRPRKDRGSAGTTLQDVAEATGTTRAALYCYVKNKDGLLTRLVEGGTLDNAARFGEIAEDPDLDATTKLRAIMNASMTEHAAWPARFRLLDRSEGDLPEPLAATHREAKRQTLEQFVRVLQEGGAAGEFVDVNTRSTALAPIGMSTWVVGSSTRARAPRGAGRRAARGSRRAHRQRPRAPSPRGAVEGTLALLREDGDTLERLMRLVSATGR